MPDPSSQPVSDRNLLFGVLAVQLNFINRDDLVSGMNSWVHDKNKSLGQIMLEQGRLTAEQVQTLEALITQHLKVHGNDPQRSLQALKAPSTAASLLTLISDSDGSVTATQDQAEPATKFDDAAPVGTRYRRLRPHAAGGLGEVFIAEDTELHREVALKEIRSKYADDRLCRNRFVREAEITGGLEHPGVVPVYGLGAYPDGRLYYAMRFIRGDSLRTVIEEFHAADKPSRAASERNLAFRDLLRRFVDVCNAVAYAHSRGVLHRDLKPANVMLGKFGETLVVDWGLAKAGMPSADREDTAEHEPALHLPAAQEGQATRAGTAVGTIPFMSPEQASGRNDRLGPASDIYSLGSTLYALLTGQRPYRGKDDAETLVKVQQGRFAPPRVVKPATPKALDAICCKAMALKPEDRYATALELADDLQHWLADEPVSAYREPWTVRAGRMARRHRTKLVASAVLLVSAVVALSISTGLVVAEQQETEKQRQVAVQNYEISRKQSFDIIALIESSEPEFASVPALHDRRKDLLTTASNACRQFLLQEPNDVVLQKRAAQIYRFAANFNRLTNETATAESLYQASTALRAKLSADNPEEELFLADIHRDHGGLQIKLGRLREASASFEKSLKITERLKTDEKDPIYRRRTALALRNLASIEHRQGNHLKSDEATRKIERATELFRGLVEGPATEQTGYDPLLLAGAMNLSAMIQRDRGQFGDAHKKHMEAVKLMKGTLEAKSKSVNEADVAFVMAECHIEQCKTWAKEKDAKFLAAAEGNLGLTINKLAALVQEYPKIPTYPEALAEAFRERGEIRLRKQNAQGAREHFLTARKLLTPLVQKHGDLPGPRAELGKTLIGLGVAARTLKDEDPLPWFEQAAAELNSALARSPDDAALRRVADDLADLRK